MDQLLLTVIVVELAVLIWRAYSLSAKASGVDTAVIDPVIHASPPLSEAPARILMARIYNGGHLHHICPVGSPDHIQAAREGSGLTVEVS